MIFWPRETVTLLESNLRYFHREKSTFEKFDAGLKLRIVFYTHKTIKNRRKNFRVIYTLRDGVNSLISNISCTKQSNLFRHFFRTKNFRTKNRLIIYFPEVRGNYPKD